MPLFNKILIANRGEIAIRVMNSCKKLGIKTVVVYSDADTNSLHVKTADEAIYIGASPSSQSYLNIPSILSAVDQSGADAVHPGYGFLSENASFAEELIKRNVVPIAPSIEAICLMGDKIESKKLAKKAGVTVVPGGLDIIQSEKEALKAANKIGYPVMVKAAAGGGGKGMRVAWNDKELKEGRKLATSEAASSFGDARIFIEKFFDNPRHIEIQILADRLGNVIHLGERECSIQRRHQKIIEEAPSMFLDEATRNKMGKQSIALAKKVGYFTVGTVEFIVDDKKNFYFLEMNTRLQVEHRVTELITGIDLVEQQIRIAAGETLKIKQKNVKFNGWAMEARIYAEDPKRGFLPSVGRITKYQEPVINNGVIVDSGVYEGDEVSMFYDPMIAKLCTHSPTRNGAIDSMREALSAYVLDGIDNNMNFLSSILGHKRFINGDISTNFIAQEYPDGFSGNIITEENLRVFLGVGTLIFIRDVERASKISGQLSGRERMVGARWVAEIADKFYPIEVNKKENGYDITYPSGLIVVRSSWKLGHNLLQGTIDGSNIAVQIKIQAEGFLLQYAGAEENIKIRTPRVAELAKYMPKITIINNENEILAPIAGLINSINVSDGDDILLGQELFTIEAMKMENVIRSTKDTKIKKIYIKQGESVSSGQMIIEFEDDEKKALPNPNAK